MPVSGGGGARTGATGACAAQFAARHTLLIAATPAGTQRPRILVWQAENKAGERPGGRWRRRGCHLAARSPHQPLCGSPEVGWQHLFAHS